MAKEMILESVCLYDWDDFEAYLQGVYDFSFEQDVPLFISISAELNVQIIRITLEVANC